MKKILTRAAVGVLLAFAALTVIGAPAYAADAPTAVVASAGGGFVLTLDVPQLLNLLIAVVFPVLVGLVTTKVTSSTLKAVLLATISLASGVVSALLAAVLAGVPFDVVSALLTGLAAWIIAIATHLGFWKPSGVTEKVQSLGVTGKGDGVASYLIGGRFLTGEITLRRVIPKSATVEPTLNAAESIRADLSLPMTDPATGMSIDIPNQLPRPIAHR